MEEATAPQEEQAPAEEEAVAEAGESVEAAATGSTSTSDAGSVESTSGVRTSATELPLHGQATEGTKSDPISALKHAVEREWKDAKPMLDKVTTPVRETVSSLPRWAFIGIGGFVVVVAVALWMIANRPVPTMPQPDAGPTTPSAAAAAVDDSKTKAAAPATTPKTATVTAPPVQPSLDQLLDAGTAAATSGNASELSRVWQDMRKRFPDPKWSSLAKSGDFVGAVAKAWQADKLGDPAKAAQEYLPVIAVAAKNTDVAILKKLSTDLQEDADAAQPYELALLNALVEDKDKSEMLLDESLRLARSRAKGAVAERSRDLIRQTLEPLVAFRERWKRPDDIDAALRNAVKALAPKLEALAATGEPSALYLYADKLHSDGRVEESMANFEKAAQLDHAPSMLQLGLLLSNAKDKSVSLPKAVYWFKRADGLGYPQASFLLGECYLDGKGVARDYAQALAKLEAAAAHDIAEAHEMLAETYMGNTPSNLPEGDDFDPAKLNPSLTGDARLERARDHFEKALKYGFSKAGGLLARLLIEGSGGPRDVARGMQLLDAASKLEDPDPAILRTYAYLLMPQLLPGVPVTREDLNAANVKPDADRVVALMRQAARANDPHAQQWCRDNGVKY